MQQHVFYHRWVGRSKALETPWIWNFKITSPNPHPRPITRQAQEKIWPAKWAPRGDLRWRGVKRVHGIPPIKTPCLCQNTLCSARPDRPGACSVITHTPPKGAVSPVCFPLRQISPCLVDFLSPEEMTCEGGKEKKENPEGQLMAH